MAPTASQDRHAVELIRPDGRPRGYSSFGNTSLRSISTSPRAIETVIVSWALGRERLEVAASIGGHGEVEPVNPEHPVTDTEARATGIITYRGYVERRVQREVRARRSRHEEPRLLQGRDAPVVLRVLHRSQ
jgi:hypothetical protein